MDICLSHVSKRFGDNDVINDVTFTIPAREICCLLGPSGSGKTTLIRLMIGALSADHGTIHFKDTPIPNIAVETIRVSMKGQLATGLYDVEG